jgi:hypothetical protein
VPSSFASDVVSTIAALCTWGRPSLVATGAIVVVAPNGAGSIQRNAGGRRHVSTNLKAELGKIEAHGQTLMSDGHA